MRILEYGCGIAPMYRTWRRFFAHIPTRWVLADIPGFPFHYARQVHGADAGVRFVTITPERFADPLQGVEGQFDLIILQEVFEHLDEPLRLAGYLVDRLAPRGLLHFDYIESDATGLDTPAGLEQRRETLKYLKSRLEIVEGMGHDLPPGVQALLIERIVAHCRAAERAGRVAAGGGEP
jgi:2-polyprenyl-3-methyl-5-hydroxy-6-metoxy-1,4-benzoquinol methylase